ncbi:unnamed protein product, partial [Phaeothamnion confervicola]
HDDVFLSEFESGWAEVSNARVGLAFRLTWDARVFPFIINWRPFGGCTQPPLTETYALGVEPWVGRSNLGKSIETGRAHWLEPGEEMTTTLQAELGRLD